MFETCGNMAKRVETSRKHGKMRDFLAFFSIFCHFGRGENGFDWVFWGFVGFCWV